MLKTKIFLASSNNLKIYRENFEIQINRKNKFWADENIFLHLEIWEDLSAKMSLTRLQDDYNKKIKGADIFVLLVDKKIGVYSKEEFEIALDSFKKGQKPFIYTYFKKSRSKEDESLRNFKLKMKELGHFYSYILNFEDLWNQFNKELDRLYLNDFKIYKTNNTIQGNVDNEKTNIKNQFNNGKFNNTTFN